MYIKDASYDKNIYLQYFDIVNPNAHTKFFLIASELVQNSGRRSEEMAGTMTPNYGTQHYTLTALVEY